MLRLRDIDHHEGGFRLKAAFSLDTPGRIAVIGPSGAGKSTLLDLIAGFRSPTRGRVFWKGQDITTLVPGKRPVAILFQDNNLFPHLSLTQNLTLALRPRGGRTSVQDHTGIKDALAAVDLNDFGPRLPGTLSGGQQSRAALARVLIQARPILLLDEPFAALGPSLKAQMLAKVSELSQQMGLLTLMVTHDPGDARSFSDQVIVVADGVAAAPQPTSIAFDNPSPALRHYLGTG